jgi:hypothetical protein
MYMQTTNKQILYIFSTLYDKQSSLKEEEPEKTRAIDDCDKGGEGLIVPFSVRQTRIGTQ